MSPFHNLDTLGAGLVDAVVAERLAWVAASLSEWDAAAYLGWQPKEFAKVAKGRGLRAGRLDR